ncbi:hypothetical protein DVH24_014319, partial [Malus domestica]
VGLESNIQQDLLGNDNIRNLSIDCESLKNKLVPAVSGYFVAASCAYLAPEKASHFRNAYWKLQNLPCNHQLKELSIKNSYGSNEIEFARYILEHAQNLRKMVIVHCDVGAPSKVAAMVSRSKMISSALVLIQQDPYWIYKFVVQNLTLHAMGLMYQNVR